MPTISRLKWANLGKGRERLYSRSEDRTARDGKEETGSQAGQWKL
jgi:hypothetical protein